MNQNETLFELYAEDGLPWALIALTAIRTFISTIGIICNLALVYVTFKTNSLNGPCNILIAFDAAACAWFEIGSWIGMYQILVGQQFVPIDLCCVYLLLPFITGIYASMSATLLIAFDRLLSICFPIWYAMRKPSRLYSFFLVLLSSLLFPGFIVQAILRLVLNIPEQRSVMCAPHECIWDWASNQNYALNTLITGTTVAIYIVIWIILLHRNQNTQNTNNSSDVWTRRILKALAFLVALQLAGHTLSSIARLAIPQFQLSVTSKAVTTFLLSCLTNIVMAVNGPVLYKMNMEYRNAFQKVFKFLQPTNHNTIIIGTQQQQWAIRVATANVRD
ncbi:hypothetical protein niasHT_039290 [Heterodera trifolii]|uniref:G-protein coupled receptors family 1 profile domain-containing protein n=1 Tax=Heterodera trifolii TaxID=157864 RepID=A0ABD2IW76_9BILA